MRRFPIRPSRKHLRPAVQTPLRAPAFTARFYRWLTLPAPYTNDPRDADRYVRELAALCDRDRARCATDPDKLTRPERASLIRLHNRWERRALGLDTRWTIAGAQTGRLRRATEALYARQPHPAWKEKL
jgi:hypothetical protein